MTQTPEQLTAEYLRRVAAGENVATALIDVALDQGERSTRPSSPSIPIDREAKPPAQLDEIARALPDLIGPGWRYQAPEPDSCREWGQLNRDDGAGFWFYLSSGRIEVAGDWPRSAIGGRQTFNPSSYQETEYSRITVALKRSAEAIASEIARRFLPGYLLEYEKKVESRDEYDQKSRAQTEITKRLAAIIDAEVRSGCNRYRPDEIADTFYGPTNCALRKCVVHYDGEADLEIRCDENTAAAILRLLKRRARNGNDG